MVNKLKSFPFCGSIKIYYSKPIAYGTPAHWLSSVSCTECGAEITGGTIKPYKRGTTVLGGIICI